MFYTINKNNDFVTNHPILKVILQNLESGMFQDLFKNIQPSLQLNSPELNLNLGSLKILANDALITFLHNDYPNYWLTISTESVYDLIHLWQKIITEEEKHDSSLLVTDGLRFYAWPNPEKPVEDQIQSSQLLKTVATYTHIPPATDEENYVTFSERRKHYNHNDPDVYVLLRNLKAAVYKDFDAYEEIVSLAVKENFIEHKIDINKDLWLRLVRTWKVFRIWEASLISLWYDKSSSDALIIANGFKFPLLNAK